MRVSKTHGASRQKISLVGYVGRGNVGDELMARNLHSFLAQRLDGRAVLQLLALPSPTRLGEALRFARMLAGSDWVLLAGGTHFHDRHGLSSLRLLAQFLPIILLARLTGGHVAYVGIGVGPLKNMVARAITRVLLSMAKLTIVRDPVSLSQVRQLAPRAPALLGFDLAVLDATDERREPAQSRLGVSLVPYFGTFEGREECDDRTVEALSNALQRCSKTVGCVSVDVFVFCEARGYSDQQISDRLVASLRQRSLRARTVRFHDLASFRAEIARLSGFLGARYHSIMLAYDAGVPVIPILYHEKCSSLADQLGLPDDGRLRPQDLLAASAIEPLLLELLTAPQRFRGTLPIAQARQEVIDVLESLIEEMTRT